MITYCGSHLFTWTSCSMNIFKLLREHFLADKSNLILSTSRICPEAEGHKAKHRHVALHRTAFHTRSQQCDCATLADISLGSV